MKVNLSNKAIGLYEKKCPICGKTFYKAGAEWGYKVGKTELCTYSCMRVAEKRAKGKKKRNRRVS